MFQNCFKQVFQTNIFRNALTTFVATAIFVFFTGFSMQQQAVQTPKNQTVQEAATNFEVDDVHSMALFGVQHLGAGRFWGIFHDVGGTVQFNPEKSLVMNITIQTDSVDSNNEKLNRHLKSPDFFNSVEFPQMSFVSISSKHIEKNRFEVVGDLTIRGVKKQVTVPVECSSISKMGGATRAGFEAAFEIKRSDYGVSYGVEKKMLGDETRIIVSLEGVEPDTTTKGKE